MFKKKHTTYVIKNDCEIINDIDLPLKSTLRFEGGCIAGKYKIKGNKSKITANNTKIFNSDVKIVGTWNVKEVYPQWFGAVEDDQGDDTEAIIAMFSFPCKRKVIPPGDYNVKEIMSAGINNSEIIAYGATLHYTRYDLDALYGERYGQILCNYSIDTKPTEISHDLGNISIYGLTIDGHRELFSYNSKATKVTALLNHHAIRFICGEKIFLYGCEFRNTFMTAVLCEGCNELIVDSCTIKHSGECEKYTPYGYFYTWEGVGLDDRCYLQNRTQTISCERCVVRNSYFEDIAGAYASGNCKEFESYNNVVINNRGYLHEISGHIGHGSRTINIHDNFIRGLGSSVCMLNNFIIEDGSQNIIVFKNNVIKGYMESGDRTIPSASQIWYENFVYGEKATGKCTTIIENNVIECSINKQSGNLTFNSDHCVVDGNTISNFGNSKENNQLIYLPRNTAQNVAITNNKFDGTNAYLVLLNYCSDSLVIKGNSINFSTKPDGLSAVVRANWSDISSKCNIKIEENKTKGLQYIYSSGVNYSGYIEILNNVTDAKMGLYFNNPINRVVNGRYHNNSLRTNGSQVTNANNGIKDIKSLVSTKK